MTITDRPVHVLLDPAMLDRFDERAPVYDRENRFFTENFEELRDCGYLLAAVPERLGGSGLTLAELVPLQRRLAYHAPATAIAVNMHLYWTGTAADLVKMGDDRLAWVLDAAADGHIFAAGHGERGNDIPALLSTSEAERVPGGWRISGHKIFGSLSPVWTYLGVHAMDTSDPNAPQVVHAFVARDAEGLRIVETWDTMGMRATSSHDTLLEAVFVPDDRVALVCPAGFAGASPFHLGMFAWGMLGFAAVYLGVADRAYDLTLAAAHRRTSIALTRSMAYHPGVQSHVADMRIAIESAAAHLERTASDWSSFADHGAGWALKIIATKHNVVKQAWQVVDTAMDLSGGAESSGPAAWNSSFATPASDASIPETTCSPTRRSASWRSASTLTASPGGDERIMTRLLVSRSRMFEGSAAHQRVGALGRVLNVWAHPDDETYLCGGLLAAANDNGQATGCITATAGEHGTSDPARWPGAAGSCKRRCAGLASLSTSSSTSRTDTASTPTSSWPSTGC
jgi:alkylation response protein AidB-like acyl-CoA dehydrogenase